MCIADPGLVDLENAQQALGNVIAGIAVLSVIPTVISGVKESRSFKIFLVITIVLLALMFINFLKPDLFIHACG